MSGSKALFVLSAFGALSAVADTTSTSDYVQDGLIAHWDAIDNAAPGTHDGSATVWKDLKDGRAFELVGATWGPNSLTFDGQNYGGTWSGGSFTRTGDTTFVFSDGDSNRTVEVVFEYNSVAASSEFALLTGPVDSHIAICRSAGSGASAPPSGLVATDYAEPTLSPNCKEGLNTISFGYEKGETVQRKADHLFLDGRTVAPTGANGTIAYALGSFVRIGKDNNQSHRVAATYYSIRVYNRLLTQDEVKQNQLVDARRFSERPGRTFYVDAENGVDDDSHDGTTEANAKKTLVEIFKLANQKGDTVWALPGTYDQGTALDAEETKYVQTNRCVVPAGVTLKSTQGAAVTFIKGRKTSGATCGVGADSIRAVRLKAGANLTGFTIRDSATVYDGGPAGGGIYADAFCVIRDCVITNCASRGCAVAQSNNDPLRRFFLLRCELVDNKNPGVNVGSALGNSSYVVVNSWIHGNQNPFSYPGGGGTCFLNCTIENQSRCVSGGSAYGCFFSGTIDSGDKLSLYDCLFASQVTYDNRVAGGYVKHGCEVGTDPVDVYDYALYEDAYRKHLPEYLPEKDLSFGQVPRVLNRTIDYGCEFDWRPTYSTDLAAQRVTVTGASSGVCETADKKVALTDGETLDVDWTAPTAGANDYSFNAAVTGSGSLSCYLNGSETPFAVVTSADGNKTVEFSQSASPKLRFVYTGDGEVKLWGFKDTISIVITIPNGGVKLTGVEPGETWVTPGTEKTFTLERTYENDRLCTGFLVNNSTFVNFDDYPNGWTHTVSNKASAVEIVAQYKTVQDFYVDPVGGDDANCGFQTNRAWKTLVTIMTNGHVRTGDVVYALPGTYDAGTILDADETKYVQTNRCIVPAGVSLLSMQGAAVTFIKGRKTDGATAGCGADSIRAVRLKTGAVLGGFTITDAATIATGNPAGGGIYADAHCVIKDCVIRNCGSYNGAIAQPNNDSTKRIFILRCEVTGNSNPLSYSGSAFGNSSYVVVNSWIHGNSNACTYPGGGGVCFLNCTIEDLVRCVSGATAYGTYFKSGFDGGDTTAVYDCLFALQSAYDNRVAGGYVKHGCEVGTDTVDAYDNALYESSFQSVLPDHLSEKDLAFGGLPRVSNRMIDYGCDEFDWRPTFSTDLAAQRVTVTAASPGVYETADKKVALTDGETLDVDWTAPTAGENEYTFSAAVTGTGSLSCYLNGSETPFAVVTSADGEKVVNVPVTGSPKFRFAYAGEGEVKLWGFKDTIAIVITIPNGGVKLTGVEPGETWVTPGTEKTFTLERTYENDRLCTGFLVNNTTFVNFDDYPNGWTHTVSNKASAVEIVAQYKTVQDFYVDPVGGNDGACGFQTNRAWKTLATVKTNANVRSGDIVYLFPGTYAEGALGLTDASVTSNRVIVPAGVRLKALSPEGSKVTFVRGAAAPNGNGYGLGDGAVRCVWLEDGAAVEGVTLTGGRTALGDSTEGCYAGVGTDYAANDPVCEIVDCVISNNVASWLFGGGYARYVRCRITDNAGMNWKSGFENSWFYNCYVAGNSGAYCFYIPRNICNCTLLAGAQAHAPNEYSYLHNSIVRIVTGCTIYSCLYGSVSANTVLVSGNRQVDFATLSFDTEGRCLSTNGIDFASNDYLSAIPAAYRSVDKDGVQRIYNGRVDAGAYEHDIRPDIRRLLGRSLASVTDASEQVLVDGNVVRLIGDGTTLKAIAKGGPVTFAPTVDGGTLRILVNGVTEVALTASGEVKLSLNAGDVVDFVHEGAGEATLPRFFGAGLMLLVR